LALYKGLGAVMTGIVPKMAIRFTSYEWYKQLLADKEGMVSGGSTFSGKQEQSAPLENFHRNKSLSSWRFLETKADIPQLDLPQVSQKPSQ
jgi:hypothetical protein